MAVSGPIIVVEDDVDDQEIIADVIKELDITNELIFFSRCPDALQFLQTTIKQPFIIICDINLPGLNGLDFKKQIDLDPQLRIKSIPFIFLSTATNPSVVCEAYANLSIQGFFMKCSNIEDFKHSISIITEYWKLCRHPNS